MNNNKESERAELHKTIWRIANDLRGSVDGWDFKTYVLGLLFYRFISENLTAYLNEAERRAGRETAREGSEPPERQVDLAPSELLDPRAQLLVAERFRLLAFRGPLLLEIEVAVDDLKLENLPPALAQSGSVFAIGEFVRIGLKRFAAIEIELLGEDFLHHLANGRDAAPAGGDHLSPDRGSARGPAPPTPPPASPTARAGAPPPAAGWPMPPPAISTPF